MIVTHCATLHHPHQQHTRHLQKTHTHHLKHIHLICLLERNSEKLFTSLEKTETDRISSFCFCQMKCNCALRQTKTTDQTNAYVPQLIQNANPMVRDQQTFGILKARHDLTLFCEPHISHRQNHHTTTPANELLTTGYEGGPHTRQHHPCPSPT